MPIAFTWRRLCAAAVVGLAVALGSLVAPPTLGGPTAAAAQVSEDFIYALEPYGRWIHHRRFGEVWIPFDLPRGWRPYEYGHWVYTDEWGWFWVSDPEEEDWGWITFHYGRWAYERRIGWFWVPGDEWAPAWVDWRYGDGYVGWAPLPPDPYIAVYEADPLFWVFVAVRHLTQPRWRHYAVSSRHRAAWMRRSHVVNRTFGVRGARLGVNPGLSPAFVAARTHRALPAYRVRPRVFAHTRGVEGALHVQRDQLRAARSAKPRGRRRGSGANAVTLQQTTTIKPSTSAAPQRLRKGQRGHLGSHPPRAAQGGTAPKQQQVQPPPPKQLQPLQQQKARQPAQQQQQRQQRHKERRDQQRDHQPPQAKPTRPLVPQTPPPAVKKLTPPPAVKKQTPPPTVKKKAPPPAPTVKQAPPPKMKKQMPAPRVKQAPPPTVRRVAPPPTMKRVAPPAQPKHPVVKHAPPPKPARVHKPRPPAKKQAAPAKRAAKPAAKKKSDDKQKPKETPK